MAGGGVAAIVIRMMPEPPPDAPLRQPFTVPISAGGVPVWPPTDPAPVTARPNRPVIAALDVDAPLLADGLTGAYLRVPSDPSKLLLYRDGRQPCAAADPRMPRARAPAHSDTMSEPTIAIQKAAGSHSQFGEPGRPANDGLTLDESGQSGATATSRPASSGLAH